MKFQRSTIILLFGALLMGGAFYYYQTLFIPAQEAREAFARKLFKFKEEDVQAIFVKTQSQTLRFERASDVSTPQNLWLMQILEVAEVKEEKPSPKATPEETAETSAETETPEETGAETSAETAEETLKSEETAATDNSNSADKITDKSTQISQEKVYANEAYVSFLLEQLVSDRSQQTLTATPEQIKEYGLNPPVAIIEVILKNQRIYQMILGKSEFSGNAIYAQVNPPLPETENQTVLVVSKNFEYAVDRTLEDWKQPPAILEENSGNPPSNETENPSPANNSEAETLEPNPEPAEANPETTEPENPENIPEENYE